MLNWTASPSFPPRSLLLRPSSSQSNQGPPHGPVLRHPLCVCGSECWCALHCGERGPGGEPQQRHGEGWILHLHQSCWLSQTPEHHQRLQIHHKYEFKNSKPLLSRAKIQSLRVFYSYFHTKAPTSTLTRSSVVSEDSTLRRGKLKFQH